MNDAMRNLINRYPELAPCADDVENAVQMILSAYRNGGTVLVCGNGGSASDSEHIVGELMKGFMLKRKMDANTEKLFRDTLGDEAEKFVTKLQRGIPAISLPSQSAIISAYSNDVDSDLVYAQLVYGYGKKSDVLICLSTSGNSKNVVNAALAAKALGIRTVSLTGKNDSRLSEISTCTVKAPESETYKVQELHLPIYHYICAEVERTLFG